MTVLDANGLDFRTLGERVRAAGGDVEINNCCGQRFIGAGMSARNIRIDGIPGNALGAYLDGAEITVHGNAQDAVGDTMNDGRIIIHGSVGDAVGYAMRGGSIFVRGNAGYRAGIHMKEYKDKVPLMVIGGCTGSFLGEYQAGGVIVVLGLGANGRRIVGNFSCTGMHGGKLFLRGDGSNVLFPAQVTARPAGEDDMAELEGYVTEYCALFGADAGEILASPFTVVTPDSKNPYKRMYVSN